MKTCFLPTLLAVLLTLPCHAAGKPFSYDPRTELGKALAERTAMPGYEKRSPITRSLNALALLASGDYQVFRAAEKDVTVIGKIVSAQREELEKEIVGLKIEAEKVAEEARELAGEVPF